MGCAAAFQVGGYTFLFRLCFDVIASVIGVATGVLILRSFSHHMRGGIHGSVR